MGRSLLFATLVLALASPPTRAQDDVAIDASADVVRQGCLNGAMIGMPVRVPDRADPKKTEWFRGAVGKFSVRARAEPTTVAVGEPLRWTLTILAAPDVPVHVAPSRPNLEKEEEFDANFHIEAVPVEKRRAANVWEYSYHLKPKSVSVKEVPPFIFGYFNPLARDDSGFEQPDSGEVAITVKPPAKKAAPAVTGKTTLPEAPEFVSELASDEAVLRRHEPWSPPSWPWIVVLLTAPPVGATLWLVAWRRFYPDAARRARLRRSRAARQALAALDRMGGSTGSSLAEQLATIFSQFLVERHDLSSVAATPAETETFLRERGVAEPLTQRVAELLRTCDALRFSNLPAPVSGGLKAAASELILALEEAAWSASHS